MEKMNIMLWYSFVLPQNEELPIRQEEIIFKLRKLINNFNEGEKKGTLLLYSLSSDLKYVKYYFTSENGFLSKTFADINFANRCSTPKFKENVNLYSIKFLEGDTNLFSKILRSK
jgi:hypothetical protein